MNIRVLIIDDDELLAYSIKRVLEEDSELEIDYRNNGKDGLALFHEKKHQIVITDLVMEGMNGLEIIETVKTAEPDSIVILITGQGNEKIFGDAIQKGAYDYFSKPFHLLEFYKTIRNAKEKIILRQSNQQLQDTISSRRKFHKMFYASEVMEKIVSIIGKISSVDVPILILGESGTGKELIAESIHLESGRRDQPFIRINCGAIPANLLESEFFGYEKGAFTGAVQSKKGKLEMADGGTVFLDEIGDLPLDLQVKLLRFLEDGSIDRIGGLTSSKVDVRVIAATNVNLDEAILAKKFRLDLYYRLDAFKIEIPPLRERKEDVIYISERLAEEYAQKFNIRTKSIPEEVKIAFLKYSWPGNVRELKNVIQNMVIFSKGDQLEPDALPKQFQESKPVCPDARKGAVQMEEYFDRKLPYREYIREMELQYLRLVLQRIPNKTEAAEFLGISRKSLYEKIKELALG